MDYKVNYTIVGLFVVVLTAVLIISAFWLSTTGDKEHYQTYQINIEGGVSGLSEQAPVKFNGVSVGYVDSIKLNPQNLKEVILLLKIKQEIPITVDTVGKLASQGITGVSYVSLEAKTAKGPLLLAQPGEKYPIIKSAPSLFVQINQAITEITDRVKSITKNIDRIFDEKNAQAVEDILQNTEHFTKTLSDNSKEIDGSIKNADVFLGNAAKASKELPQTVTEFRSTLKSIKSTSQSVQHSLETQLLPSTTRAMDRLNNVLINMESLTSELKQNPAMLIRGKQLPPPGPGE